MIKIILCCGGIASGKSTWAIAEVSKDPEGTVRINRDSLRNMLSNYHISDKNEKLVTTIREAAITTALKRGLNIILDETNLRKENFDQVCTLARKLNIECVIMEKPFYVELDEALSRNSSRTGTAKIPDDIVHKFWKKSGGKQFKYYKARTEVITRNSANQSETVAIQDENKKHCIICDLDGTLALIGNRNPYDAKDCDIIDFPNKPVINTVQLYYNAGKQILFVSGREDKFEPETRRFIEKYLPNIKYELHMRKTNDFRSDNLVKEEIYETHIKNNYYVELILDDRTKVVDFWRSIGLVCFQVAPGDF